MSKRINIIKSVLTPTEAILESISDGVFTVDKDWCISSFNRAAEEITGVSRKEATGRRCSEVFRSSMCGEDCALKMTMKTGKPIIGKAGYIIDTKGNRIPISISTALLKDDKGRITGGAETFRNLSDVEALRQELAGRHTLGDLVSRSSLMQRIFEVLPSIAVSPSTVLILGETGTGKELIARTIHELSTRVKGPFCAINCGALPDNLLESELFGYKAGAFTDAKRDKPGRFAMARGGTLFLDEIEAISQAFQVRLLRVLQERIYEPLGSTRSEQTDARIIVAANKDLTELMRKGAFREDFYYRINVVRVELPPLRKRKEDIPLLAEHFISRFNRLQNRSVQGIEPEALSLLLAHEWPGNVRELENVIESSFVLCHNGFIGVGHLPEELTLRWLSADNNSDAHSAHNLIDEQSIRTTLERTGYNRLAAAKELGIHKATLFRRMKKLGITLPKKGGRTRN
jgi:PAS domain S-box-containing protein